MTSYPPERKFHSSQLYMKQSEYHHFYFICQFCRLNRSIFISLLKLPLWLNIFHRFIYWDIFYCELSEHFLCKTENFWIKYHFLEVKCYSTLKVKSQFLLEAGNRYFAFTSLKLRMFLTPKYILITACVSFIERLENI